MTPEQRLDRLERIAKLLANAGMRARRELRRDFWNHDHKINYLADLQIENEARFAKLAESQVHLDESHARLAESQAHLDESHAKLAESQANTNQRLDALIDILKNGNGGSSVNN
ncbi:MAG: hypothetical protein ND866_30730 [Pyrinomonadaceae bacterium]|nr:hypothetical protein [Pyrinomonadaceae bacterium]